MERICLLNPPAFLIKDEGSVFRKVANTMPATSLPALAAVLSRKRFAIRALDAQARGYTVKKTLDWIKQTQPDILGFTCYSSSMHIVSEIAAVTKTILPRCSIIVGGPHISAIARCYAGEIDKNADFAVCGEGERTFPELLEAILSGADYRTIAGMYYRDEENWIATADRPPIANLDSLPFPAWDLIDGFPGRYNPPVFSYTRGPAAPIISSRGCPFQCQFCDHSVFGYEYRYHSVDYIMEEIHYLVKDFGVNHILFVDDHLSLRKNRLHALCEAIIKSELTINWTADARIDSLDIDDLIAMKRAGCVRINCGLESGDPDILKAMKKNIDYQKAEKTLHLASLVGIQRKGLFIVGFPGENEMTIRETVRYLKKLELTEINLSKFAPYPGTPYYDSFRTEMSHAEFWKNLDGLHFCNLDIETKKFLDYSYYKILFAFYHRFKVFNNYARLFLLLPESRRRVLLFLKEFFVYSLMKLKKKVMY